MGKVANYGLEEQFSVYRLCPLPNNDLNKLLWDISFLELPKTFVIPFDDVSL